MKILERPRRHALERHSVATRMANVPAGERKPAQLVGAASR